MVSCSKSEVLRHISMLAAAEMNGRRWLQAATCEILREHIADSAVVDRRVGTVNVNASLYHMINDILTT